MNAPDPNDPLRDLFQRQREAVRESAPAWSSQYLRDVPSPAKRKRSVFALGLSAAAACVLIAIVTLKPSGSGQVADLSSLPPLLPSTTENQAVIPLTASILPQFQSTTDFLLPQTKPVIQIL